MSTQPFKNSAFSSVIPTQSFRPRGHSRNASKRTKSNELKQMKIKKQVLDRNSSVTARPGEDAKASWLQKTSQMHNFMVATGERPVKKEATSLNRTSFLKNLKYKHRMQGFGQHVQLSDFTKMKISAASPSQASALTPKVAKPNVETLRQRKRQAAKEALQNHKAGEFDILPEEYNNLKTHSDVLQHEEITQINKTKRNAETLTRSLQANELPPKQAFASVPGAEEEMGASPRQFLMSDDASSRAVFLSQRAKNMASKSQNARVPENKLGNIVGSEYQFDDGGQLKSDRFSRPRQQPKVKSPGNEAGQSVASLYQLGSEGAGSKSGVSKAAHKKLFPQSQMQQSHPKHNYSKSQVQSTTYLPKQNQQSQPFLQPTYMCSTIPASIEQTFSQKMLSKGDWSPGVDQKALIKDTNKATQRLINVIDASNKNDDLSALKKRLAGSCVDLGHIATNNRRSRATLNNMGKEEQTKTMNQGSQDKLDEFSADIVNQSFNIPKAVPNIPVSEQLQRITQNENYLIDSNRSMKKIQKSLGMGLSVGGLKPMANASLANLGSPKSQSGVDIQKTIPLSKSKSPVLSKHIIMPQQQNNDLAAGVPISKQALPAEGNPQPYKEMTEQCFKKDFVNHNLNGYKKSVPDYMRINPEHLDAKNVSHPNRISVISKANGWLTVDSQTLSRKNAYEKYSVRLVNRETSPLSPSWMQNVNQLKRDEQSLMELKRAPLFGHYTRVEDNRIILFDSRQPLRNGNHLQSTNSIFHANDAVANRKQFHQIYRDQMKRLGDYSQIYTNPQHRLQYQNQFVRGPSGNSTAASGIDAMAEGKTEVGLEDFKNLFKPPSELPVQGYLEKRSSIRGNVNLSMLEQHYPAGSNPSLGSTPLAKPASAANSGRPIKKRFGESRSGVETRPTTTRRFTKGVASSQRSLLQSDARIVSKI